MPSCKICGRPIVECDMNICRKCRSGECTTLLNLLQKVFYRIYGYNDGFYQNGFPRKTGKYEKIKPK